MLTADEKAPATESSPVADEGLTLQDVDFGTVERDVMNLFQGKPTGESVATEPKPAESAPAADLKASEPEKPAPSAPQQKYLTEADVDRMVKEGIAAANKKPEPEDPEPLLSEDRFKDHDDWTKEHTQWRKREAAREQAKSESATAEARTRQQGEAAETERRTKTWNDRCEAAKATYPDWDEVTTKLKATSITEEMVPALQFMSDSPQGPHLWIHYGKNMQEFEQLVKMSPEKQDFELRFMERQLERTPPQPPAKTVSSAPPPPRPMPSRAAAGDPLEDPDDYASTERKILGKGGYMNLDGISDR